MKQEKENSSHTNYLNGRNILVISPKFFGYETRIVEHLRNLGANVWFLDERPGNSFWVKALVRLNSFIIKPYIHKYYNDAMRRFKDIEFDDILINSPECCSRLVVKRIKKQYPHARFILYMWDSLNNKHSDKEKNIPLYLALYNRCLSFDEEDSRQYGMMFRPLFFVAQANEHQDEAQEFAFSFIGTIHSDRYRIVKTFCDGAKIQQLKYFIYLFLPSKAHYWWYRLTKPEFRGTCESDFAYQPLAYTEVMRIFYASQSILDIEHPQQRGLTIRTLEVVGAGKKLITTNKNIKTYPFYDPSRISLIDRDDPEVAPSFFQTDPGFVTPSHIEDYEIHEWVREVFDY